MAIILQIHPSSPSLDLLGPPDQSLVLIFSFAIDLNEFAVLGRPIRFLATYQFLCLLRSLYLNNGTLSVFFSGLLLSRSRDKLSSLHQTPVTLPPVSAPSPKNLFPNRLSSSAMRVMRMGTRLALGMSCSTSLSRDGFLPVIPTEMVGKASQELSTPSMPR